MSNIEEDIELLRITERQKTYRDTYSPEVLQAIENILADRERLIRENEELKNKISLKQFDINVIYTDYKEKLEEYKNNSISKDKIREIFNIKIYNYNYLSKTDWYPEIKSIDKEIANILEICLQELLEEDK